MLFKKDKSRVILRSGSSRCRESASKRRNSPYKGKRHRISRSVSGERRTMASQSHRKSTNRKPPYSLRSSNHERKSRRDGESSRRRTPSPRHSRRDYSSLSGRGSRDAPRARERSNSREVYSRVRDERLVGHHKPRIYSNPAIYLRPPPVAVIRPALPPPPPRNVLIPVIEHTGIRVPNLPRMFRPVLRPVAQVMAPVVVLRPLRPHLRPIGIRMPVYREKYI